MDKIAQRDKQNSIQHQKGKLGVWERINLLFDEGTFQELDALVEHRCNLFGMDEKKIPGDGVITGFGDVFGRKVFLYAQDFTVFGGALSEMQAAKICKVMDLAKNSKVPIIGLCDSGGARIQEGVNSLGGYAEIFWRNVQVSGYIPQISVILGPCAGGAVYSPAITDFIYMVEDTSFMFVTGPNVVKTVTHEDITFEELGGASTHSSESGVAHFAMKNEIECFQHLKKLISILPANKDEKPPVRSTSDSPNRSSESLEHWIPSNSNQPYDVTYLIKQLADDFRFIEISEYFAKNIVIGFVHLNQKLTGVIANQPNVLAGVLDIDSSRKAARFVRFCDSFNIPLLTLVDVPGFLPGVNQEHNGVILHGAKLLYAFSEATVPKITVILRKAYGGAYDVMSSKHIRADFNFAWPSAEVAVMGAKGAVEIIFKKQIQNAENKAEELDKLSTEFQENFLNPLKAAQMGYIDDIIPPSKTREILINHFKILEGKEVEQLPKKHGNIPL